MFASLIFSLIQFRARNGLSQAPDDSISGHAGEFASAKRRARETGIRGETYAYWYLRRSGYTMVARNYTFPGFKGEIDMVGYDGSILAFVEVKTRSINQTAQVGAGRLLPEDAVDWEKRRNLSRIAQQFLRARRLHSVSHRFDILAIENRDGTSPALRLTKGAFQMK